MNIVAAGGTEHNPVDTLFFMYTTIDRKTTYVSRKSKKDSKGREEEWSWEETPETIEALKKLHATKRLHEDIRKLELKRTSIMELENDN